MRKLAAAVLAVLLVAGLGACANGHYVPDPIYKGQ
jgi:hypothetical protein